MIYVIQAGDAVKIGYSASNVEARLGAVQTSSPHRCEIVALMGGNRADERRLHNRFRGSHLRGEWFRLTDDIKALVAEHPGSASRKPARDREVGPHFTTADGVIDALGGTGAVARLTGRGEQAVSNWRARGRIAARLILVFEAALKSRGLSADEAIWSQSR